MTFAQLLAQATSAADRAEFAAILLLALMSMAGFSVMARLAARYVFGDEPIPEDRIDDFAVDGLDMVVVFFTLVVLPGVLAALLVGRGLIELTAAATAGLAGAAMTAVYLAVSMTFRPRRQGRGFGGWPTRPGRQVWTAVKALLVAAPLALAAAYLVSLLNQWITGEPPARQVVVQVFFSEDRTTFQLLLLTVLAVVGAPVGEELVFRGVLLRYLRQKMTEAGWSKAFFPGLPVLATSGIFAMMHMPSPAAVAATFMLGAVLGVVMEKTGNVWPCILIHMMFNGVNVIVIFYQRAAGLAQ